MKRLMAAITFCALVFGGTSAMADARMHDGFYMQFGVGLGGFHSSAEMMGIETSYGGLTIPAQFLLGGTIAKHLVIGGGFFLDTAPKPKFKIDGKESSATPDFTQYIIGLGAILDYYIWSDKGLHFPVFIGWGGLETSTDNGAGGSDPTGLMMYFGVGYDHFISDSWSIGGVFRFVIAPLKIDDVKYTTIEPGVLFTMTFH